MNKKIVIASAIAIVLLLIGAIYLWQSNDNADSQTSQENTEVVEVDNADQTEETTDGQNDVPNPLPDPKNPTPQTPPSEVRTVTITRASVTNGNVVVAAIVEDGLLSDVCTLLMSKDGQPDQRFENPVIQQSSYNSCKNFVVETSSLPSGGEWSIQILINEGTGAGESNVQNITI